MVLSCTPSISIAAGFLELSARKHPDFDAAVGGFRQHFSELVARIFRMSPRVTTAHLLRYSVAEAMAWTWQRRQRVPPA